MKKIAELVLGIWKKFVVLSALVRHYLCHNLIVIGDNLFAGQKAKAEEETVALQKHYHLFY